MAMIRRHMRFLVALLCGLAVGLLAATSVRDAVLEVLLAVNAFFLIYLGMMLHLTLTTTVADLRRHAEADDEGSALILLLAAAAVVVSLSSIFLVLNRPHSDSVTIGFALISAPLGWALIHVLMAYRYAHLYYSADPDEGLEFPNDSTPNPGVWDFLYVAFTIGMTAQVSDVQVTTVRVRKVVLLHGVGSFFYNTVILALAVNAGIALTS